MKHPERLNVYGVNEPFRPTFIVWLFLEAVGIVGIVGVVALLAHAMSR